MKFFEVKVGEGDLAHRVKINVDNVSYLEEVKLEE